MPIGGTGHDEFLYRFDVPTIRYELGGEPVEQFGVAWPFALHPEIFRRFHQAPTKVFQPIAIYGHATGERVFAAD